MITILVGLASLIGLIAFLHFFGFLLDRVLPNRKDSIHFPETVAAGFAVICMVVFVIVIAWVLGGIVMGTL